MRLIADAPGLSNRHRPPAPPRGKFSVCLDCERRFRSGTATCPACGSDEHIPLDVFLALRLIVDDLTGVSSAQDRRNHSC